jgi:hypothetical protein
MRDGLGIDSPQDGPGSPDQSPGEEECTSRAGLLYHYNLLTGYSLDCGLIPRNLHKQTSQELQKRVFISIALYILVHMTRIRSIVAIVVGGTKSKQAELHNFFHKNSSHNCTRLAYYY